MASTRFSSVGRKMTRHRSEGRRTGIAQKHHLMASRKWHSRFYPWWSASLRDLGGLPRCYLQTAVPSRYPLVGQGSRSCCKSDARKKAWQVRRSNDILSAAAAYLNHSTSIFAQSSGCVGQMGAVLTPYRSCALLDHPISLSRCDHFFSLTENIWQHQSSSATRSKMSDNGE